MSRLQSTVVAAVTALALCALDARPTSAQHAVIRLKGRATTERGEPIANAELRAEAFFGFAAGTFSGQRLLKSTTNAKGEWSVVGFQPGIWLFEVVAPGYVPETVVLPLRILTTVSSGVSGLMLEWQLILKPVPPPQGDAGQVITAALEAAGAGKTDIVQQMLSRVPEDADGDYLADAGRIALHVRDTALARALFTRAIERDPSSYRAALGVASIFLLNRDFDSASRAFDATRSRTHDKDELRFLSAAIGDLATIKMR